MKYNSIVVITSLTGDSTANYLILALKRTGRSIYVLSDNFTPLVDRVVTRNFDIAVILKVLNIQPDLIFFIEGGSMKLFPRGLETVSCTTCWYGIDTHMDYAKHLAIASLFDVTFLAQYEYVDKMIMAGVKQVHWLPLAWEPSLSVSAIPEKKYLVSFIGSIDRGLHPERADIILELSSKFKNSYFGKASPIEMASIYGQSLLVFNKSINNDVNMRFFEAAGEGAVLVTDMIENNGVDELFERGVHFVEYESKEDCILKISQLLERPELLIEMGKKARSHVKIRHTYDNRVADLLSISTAAKRERNVTDINYMSVYMHLGMFVSVLKVLKFYFKNVSFGLSGRVRFFFIDWFLELLICQLLLLDFSQDIIKKVKRYFI